MNLNKSIIRSASKKDIESVFSIEQHSFKNEAFSKRQFKYLLTSQNVFFFVYESSESIKGYIILTFRKTSKRLRIYSIAVDNEARNQGIGASLLRYAEEVALKNKYSEIYLEVSEHNEKAIHVYLKFGYTITGMRKNYYDIGVHALLMKKTVFKIGKAQ